MPDSADILPLVVLGVGRAEGRVARRRPLDWHGIPGLAWKLEVDLPDGTRAEAMQIGSSTPVFLDPRIAVGRA
jgi:hypothetical protein